MGHHTMLYFGDLEKPNLNQRFNVEWGILRGIRPGWREWTVDELSSRIQKASSIEAEALKSQYEVFVSNEEQLRDEIVIALAQVHTAQDLLKVKELLAEVEATVFDNSEEKRYIAAFIDACPRMTRDVEAISAGRRLPAHTYYEALAHHIQMGCKTAEGLWRSEKLLLRRLEQYYEQGGRMALFDRIARPTSTRQSPNGTKVFIGHGGSPVWLALKLFLIERLGVECDDFNAEAVAGISTTARLQEMLECARLAFLIMTGEDHHVDGAPHARENVIHEAGLFQGRLGFEKAIILLEQGCTEFSNIHGLSTIHFPKGNLEPAYENIRRVLEREGVI